MYVCMHEGMNVCMYSIYVCMYVCMNVCMYVCMSVCMYLLFFVKDGIDKLSRKVAKQPPTQAVISQKSGCPKY